MFDYSFQFQREKVRFMKILLVDFTHDKSKALVKLYNLYIIVLFTIIGISEQIYNIFKELMLHLDI